MPSGVIILNKGEGLTSQSAVNRTKRLFSERKAGHTGTLDPLATGVLPILLGRGVKASEYMLTSDKHYAATLTLGITTDTEDITGEVLSKCDTLPTEAQVIAAAMSFVGEYMQTPPMYSALKVGGKKLCDLARDGKEVEREARRVTINSLDIKRLDEKTYSLVVHCSKGTYIRTLCADIGKALGCGAVMSALERCEASGFTLAESYTLEELENMSEAERLEKIVPLSRLFERLGYRAVSFSGKGARHIRNGLTVSTRERVFDGERIAIYDGEEFVAVGVGVTEGEEFLVKPVKQFIL